MHEIAALSLVTILYKKVPEAASCWLPLRKENFWPVAREMLISANCGVVVVVVVGGWWFIGNGV
jgi:hypothetical protein